MNKIDEIKMHLNPYSIPMDEFVAWAKGFDAAMDLQLPVKFALWMDDDDNWLSIAHNSLKIPQLYEYWIENIYKPELT